MPANRFFDTLREPTEADKQLRDQYTPNDVITEAYEDYLSPIEISDPAQQAFALRSGFVQQPADPNNPDAPAKFVTPSNPIAQYMDQRERSLQQARFDKRDEIKNNFLFKVGDTLADTGRFFLSPLFWLGGMDTTQYDPSARVDSGYRSQFQKSEEYRAALYTKVANARQSRIDAANTLQQKQLDNRGGLSPESKKIYDHAVNTSQLGIWNQQSPEGLKYLGDQQKVFDGEAFYLGDSGRVMLKGVFEKANEFGVRFETKAEKATEAYSGYKALMESLSDPSGISDVAAIFSFMKSLDPRSVVRDSEFQMAAGASGIWEEFWNLRNKVKKGEILPETTRRDMEDLATRLVGHWENSYKAVRKNYERRVGALTGNNPEDILLFLGDEKVLPDFSEQLGNRPPVTTAPELLRRPTDETPNFDPQVQLPENYDFSSLGDFDLDAYIAEQEGALNGNR